MVEEKEINQDVEKLYVDSEPKEMVVGGVTIKYKELSGMEYNQIMSDLGITGTEDAKDFPQSKFMKEIIQRCIIEPEGIDVDRLKASYLIEIANKVQGGFGNLEESGLKNLKIE